MKRFNLNSELQVESLFEYFSFLVSNILGLKEYDGDYQYTAMAQLALTAMS